MAVDAGKIQELLQQAAPKTLDETRVTPAYSPTPVGTKTGYQFVGYQADEPVYNEIQVPNYPQIGWYSPSLGRNLTENEARFVRPIEGQVPDSGGEGSGYRVEEVGRFFVGEKLAKVLTELGANPEYIKAQDPGYGPGILFNPLDAFPTTAGPATNFALTVRPGGTEVSAYPSGTLLGSYSADKVLDALAKAANTALLTSVGGMALGPAGAGLLGSTGAGAVAGAALPAIQGKDTQDIIRGALGGAVSGYLQPAPIVESMPTSFGAGMPFDEAITAAQAADLAGLSGIAPEMAASNLGLLEGSMGLPGVMVPPDVAASNLGLLEASIGPPLPSSMPGVPDLRLDVMPQPQVQPALGNLDKSMLFSDTGYGGMGPTQWWETITPGDAASTLGQIEGSMGGFGGAPTEFVGPLLQTGNADKSVLLGNEGYGPMSDLTVNEAPITSSPITSLGPSATLKDVLDYLTGGGAATAIGDQLMNRLKGMLGTGATTTQQQSGFGSLANTALAALLANKAPSAPQAGVSAGKAPDIVGPVASLLAPKLVQRQPISLL